MRFRLFSGRLPKRLTETTVVPINTETLVLLAQVYDDYVLRKWHYCRDLDSLSRHFMLNHCIGHFPAFQTQLSVVRKGMAGGWDGADKAYRLFVRLYYEGFQNGHCKKRIRGHFEKVFPAEVLAQLDTRMITVKDALELGIFDHRPVLDKCRLGSPSRW